MTTLKSNQIIATGGYDNSIRFWDIDKGLSTRYMSFQQSQINCLKISNDKATLGASGYSSIKLYDIVKTFRPYKSYQGHKNNITSFGFKPDMRWLYSGSEDGTIKTWDNKTSTFQRSFQNASPVTSVLLHPNEKQIISSDQNGAIRVWDIGMGVCRHQLIPNSDEDQDVPIRTLSMTSNASLLVAGAHNGVIYVWQMTPSGQFIDYQTLENAHDGVILKIQISPDYERIASCGSDKKVKLWVLNSQKEEFEKEKTLHGHKKWVWDCAFSSDGGCIATVSTDMVLKVWKTDGGFIDLSGHSKGITSLAMSK